MINIINRFNVRLEFITYKSICLLEFIKESIWLQDRIKLEYEIIIDANVIANSFIEISVSNEKGKHKETIIIDFYKLQPMKKQHEQHIKIQKYVNELIDRVKYSLTDL